MGTIWAFGRVQVGGPQGPPCSQGFERQGVWEIPDLESHLITRLVPTTTGPNKMMDDQGQPSMRPMPSSSGDDSHDEDEGSMALQLLHRGTSVLISGNQRTKQALVGLKGRVRKAVGLGGWHWLRLSSGEEVRLQRNALTVLEPPTGHQESVRCCIRWF